MKINVSVEITTDEQQKATAVAAARAIVSDVIKKNFPPGGVVHNAPIQAMAAEELKKNYSVGIGYNQEPEVICQECKALYGAHRADCSFNLGVKGKETKIDIINCLETELKDLKNTAARDQAQIQRLLRNIEIERETGENLRKELAKLKAVPTTFMGLTIDEAVGRVDFVSWLKEYRPTYFNNAWSDYLHRKK